MALPNNTLSSTPLPAPFEPPRTVLRSATTAGLSDVHLGGVALGDPSQGLNFQLWTAFTDGTRIWLQAPNTPPFVFLTAPGSVWVALAFDQNARAFVAYADQLGNANYYWFDTTIQAYRLTPISGVVRRVFAALDDNRPITISGSDIILAYVRAGTLFMRVQRDRFGVEYNLGAAPAGLVQIGMNTAFRFQFAFQNTQSNRLLPPAEWSPYLGFNEPS